MANYISATRTNYFHVTDEEKFLELMSRCSGEDEIEIWSDTKEDGNKTFGFGVQGTFDGIYDPENENEDANDAMDRFIRELQALIRPDDACIITNAGWEKLRYVGGNALVITRDKVYNADLFQCAIKKTQELLDDPAWETEV